MPPRTNAAKVPSGATTIRSSSGDHPPEEYNENREFTAKPRRTPREKRLDVLCAFSASPR